MEIPEVCEHLQPMAEYLIASGAKVTYAGQAWSTNCRLWIYFDQYLDLEDLQRRFPPAPCITLHTNDDPKSGTERGLVCTEHHDALMGRYTA